MLLQCGMDGDAGEDARRAASWLGAATLESLAELNELGLALLAEQAAAAAEPRAALLREVGALWRTLDPLARRRAAAVPYLLLGMPPGCAALIADLSLRRIHTLAERHPEWLRPRWPAHPELWRELLLAAGSGEARNLAGARLHGLRMLAAEARRAAGAVPAAVDAGRAAGAPRLTSPAGTTSTVPSPRSPARP